MVSTTCRNVVIVDNVGLGVVLQLLVSSIHSVVKEMLSLLELVALVLYA